MSALSSISVRRPVLAVVMSVTIVIFGIIGAVQLSIREYPSVDPPVITVTTVYTGADPAAIEGQITEPLESEINTTPGIKKLTSSSRQGQSTITIEFEIGEDLERAANDVRARVDRALGDLPADAEPPIVEKQDANSSPIAFIVASSDERNLMDVTDVADNTVAEQLQTINGISQILVFGSKEYTMRLWLDPGLMAAYRITPADVQAAVLNENTELPSGRIESDLTETTVRTLGRLETERDFNNLILRQDVDRVLRLQDVGYAELAPNNLRQRARYRGRDVVALGILAQAGANQINIINEVRDRLPSVIEDVPDDVDVEFVYDGTEFVRDSIAEVIQTILTALFLVVLVVFTFLRDWRTTVIPLLVIPVSLIGAFFVMYMAGFSVNVLSLLAVVLAIGLVVDDAIVVMENIYEKIEEGMSPTMASIVGSREVFFAVIATTIALVAVFMPILFISGLVGQLFREFAITIAGAVIISSFAALTLTPMISSRLLKQRAEKPWIYRKTEPYFQRLNRSYERALDGFLNRRWLALPVILVSGGLVYLLFITIPQELAPLEDRSLIQAFAQGPEGASFEYMDVYVTKQIDLVEQEVPENDFTFAVTSPGFGASGAVNSSFTFIRLKETSERERAQNEIAGPLQGSVGRLTQAQTYVIQPPTIEAGGTLGGLPVQYVLRNLNRDKIQEVLPQFVGQVFQNPTFAFAQVDLKFTSPELNVRIDRERARSLGITARELNQAMQLALGGIRYDYFLMNGRQYEVVGQLQRSFRDDFADLSTIYVRTASGESVPLGNFVEFAEAGTPAQLYRYDRLPSATISAALAPGYTLGQGIEAMDGIAANVLDGSFSTALDGEAGDFAETGSSIYFVFILALVLIYLVLAAQFESFRDPLTILLTVPLALSGALFLLWYVGQTVNIFSQIGMVMLVGLVTKNGILIVEFANQRRAAGADLGEAIREAARVRFRPILMTAFSTVLGILPIALALGAGSTSRSPMGVVVIGGMLVGTLLALFVVPAMYTFLTGQTVSPTQAVRTDELVAEYEDLYGDENGHAGDGGATVEDAEVAQGAESPESSASPPTERPS